MTELWVEYLGQLPVTVEHLGVWEPGGCRLVPDSMASRLLTRPDFRQVELDDAPEDGVAPPVADPAPTGKTAPKSGSRRSGAS